jgi:multiple sugar transport system permease protein
MSSTETRRSPGAAVAQPVRTAGQAALRAAGLAGIGLLLLLCLFPLFWMFKTSLEPPQIVVTIPPTLLPRNPSLDNYFRLFTDLPIARWFFNSAFVAGTRTIATLIFASLAGYAFAKLNFRGRDVLFWSMLSVVMVPGFLTYLPLYRLMRDLGWYDSYLALIVPGMTGGAWAMFLMRQFMRSIPTEIIEAARIDGASEPRIFAQIVMPLSLPGLAVLGIFTFMGSWNNLIWPLLVVQSKELYPLTVALAFIRSGSASFTTRTDLSLLMAGSAIVAIPMIIVFVAFQRYFMRGITIGALKG